LSQSSAWAAKIATEVSGESEGAASGWAADFLAVGAAGDGRDLHLTRVAAVLIDGIAGKNDADEGTISDANRATSERASRAVISVDSRTAVRIHVLKVNVVVGDSHVGSRRACPARAAISTGQRDIVSAALVRLRGVEAIRGAALAVRLKTNSRAASAVDVELLRREAAVGERAASLDDLPRGAAVPISTIGGTNDRARRAALVSGASTDACLVGRAGVERGINANVATRAGRGDASTRIEERDVAVHLDTACRVSTAAARGGKRAKLSRGERRAGKELEGRPVGCRKSTAVVETSL